LEVAGNGHIAVVNLGGFCNITQLSGVPAVGSSADFLNFMADELDHSQLASLARDRTPRFIRGTDVCPCNQLLDAISRQLWGMPYDADGQRAAKGQVHADAFEDLQAILKRLASEKRSLGTGDETANWIEGWRQEVEPNDLAATACEAIADAIG